MSGEGRDGREPVVRVGVPVIEDDACPAAGGVYGVTVGSSYWQGVLRAAESIAQHARALA